jgi:hypothetical protein
LVHQHNGVPARGDGLGQFGEEKVHRGGVEVGHHQRHAGAARRAHGADDPGRAMPEVAPPARGTPRCHQMWPVRPELRVVYWLGFHLIISIQGVGIACVG